jgi:hypothetical protein
MPDCYFGPTWPATYSSGFGQSRDSDCLERCNFKVAFEAILNASTLPTDDETRPQIVRENHWAVGWVEWIAIHQDDNGALKRADELRDDYAAYPSLNDDKLSEMEQQEANEVWANCYDVSERVEYIRQYRSQFEFHNYADLLGCVRGQYFAGYASELIYR